MKLAYVSLLTYNTFYPIKLIDGINKKEKLIEHDRCLYYNNSCTYKIQDVNNLDKYKNLFIDDFDIPLSSAMLKIQRLGFYTIRSENKIMVEQNNFGEILIVGTPLEKNKCRLFIYNNIPNYKSTLFYINLKIVINNIYTFFN
jgi:hypothetical protein